MREGRACRVISPNWDPFKGLTTSITCLHWRFPIWCSDISLTNARITPHNSIKANREKRTHRNINAKDRNGVAVLSNSARQSNQHWRNHREGSHRDQLWQSAFHSGHKLAKQSAEVSRPRFGTLKAFLQEYGEFLTIWTPNGREFLTPKLIPNSCVTCSIHPPTEPSNR